MDYLNLRKPDVVREMIRALVKYPVLIYPSRGEQGAITGALMKYMGGTEYRRLSMAWLFAVDGQDFEPISSKSLSAEQWYALKEWVGYEKGDDGKWRTRPEFPVEAALVVSAAAKAYLERKVSARAELPAPPDATFMTAVELGGESVSIIDSEVDVESAEMEMDAELRADVKRRMIGSTRFGRAAVFGKPGALSTFDNRSKQE